jgi:hypothetical protein
VRYQLRWQTGIAMARRRRERSVRAVLTTSDAIEELKLRRGDSALAIIKSTEVMIAREVEEPAGPSRRRRARR